jgi:hypothetical protein
MRLRLAVWTAILFLAASLICTIWAVVSLFGILAFPAMLTQMIVFTGALLIALFVMPSGPRRAMNTGRLMSFRPERPQLRAILTGPFAEMSRPRRGWFRRRAALFQWPLIALGLAAQALLPFFFLGLAIFLIRAGAFEANPLATRLDQLMGTQPKLLRNRRRDWQPMRRA